MQMDGPSNWLARPMGRKISEALADTPVVCLLGPRQCGKSTLARRVEPDRANVTLDDTQVLQVAREDPIKQHLFCKSGRFIKCLP